MMLKKSRLKLLYFILIIASIVVSSPGRTLEADAAINEFEIISHRGFEDQYPENTVYSAKKALEIGLPVEFDVQFTKDGKMVVIHDKDVDRTTNGTGLVKELKYSYIQRLDAGSFFSKKYRGLRIPSFEEYLEAVKNMHHIYPELKDYRTAEDIKEFTRTIIEYDFEEISTILTFDFSKVLPNVREISNKIRVGALCGDQNTFERYLDLAEKDENSVMVISKKIATEENLKKIKDRNLDVIVWTIRSEREMIQLKNIGFKKFITSRYITIN